MFEVHLIGLNGTGKSTQAPLISQYLHNKGYDVFTEKEPSNSRVGNRVRDASSTPLARLINSVIDRGDIYNDRNLKMRGFNLAHDTILIKDRSYLCSCAYNCENKVTVEEVFDNQVDHFGAPDLVVFFEADIDLLQDRLNIRNRPGAEEDAIKTNENYLQIMGLLVESGVNVFHVFIHQHTKESLTQSISGYIHRSIKRR